MQKQAAAGVVLIFLYAFLVFLVFSFLFLLFICINIKWILLLERKGNFPSFWWQLYIFWYVSVSYILLVSSLCKYTTEKLHHMIMPLRVEENKREKEKIKWSLWIYINILRSMIISIWLLMYKDEIFLLIFFQLTDYICSNFVNR